MEYDGSSAVRAPLAATPGGDGFLAKADGDNIAAAGLDNEKRLKGIAVFDVLSQLNPELYANMPMFGGDAK